MSSSSALQENYVLRFSIHVMWIRFNENSVNFEEKAKSGPRTLVYPPPMGEDGVADYSSACLLTRVPKTLLDIKDLG